MDLGKIKDEAIALKRNELHGKTNSEIIGIMQLILLNNISEKEHSSTIELIEVLKTLIEKTEENTKAINEINKTNTPRRTTTAKK